MTSWAPHEAGRCAQPTPHLRGQGHRPGLVDRGVEQLLAELTSSRRPARHADRRRHGGDGRSPSRSRSTGYAPSGTRKDGDRAGDRRPGNPAFLADRRIVVLRDAEHLNAGQAAELADAARRGVLAERARDGRGRQGPARLPPKAIKGRAGRSTPRRAPPPRHAPSGSPSSCRAPLFASTRPPANCSNSIWARTCRGCTRSWRFSAPRTARVGGSGPADWARFSGRKGEPRPGTSPTRSTRATWRPQCGSPTACSGRAGGTPSSSSRCCTSTTGRCCGSTAAASPTAQQPRWSNMAAYPARKVFDQGRKLGPERIGRAVGLIADADLDLRGVMDWPDELVIEVLVARSGPARPHPFGRTRRPPISRSSTRGRAR